MLLLDLLNYIESSLGLLIEMKLAAYLLVTALVKSVLPILGGL